MLDNNLKCMNDGSHTRINKATGGLSVPDITFCTPGISPRVKWATAMESDMDSDHLPIVIEVKQSGVQTISTTPLKAR